MIVCGWCGHPSTSDDRCSVCGHPDPAIPWEHRGQRPPRVTQAELDRADRRRRLAAARRELEEHGQAVTNAALAELLGIDTRTVRRWMSAK